MQLHAHLQVEADTEDRDVDSRVAAVRSLALTLQTLGASQAGAQPLRERGSESLAALLQQHALPFLLAPLQAYRTDNTYTANSPSCQPSILTALLCHPWQYCRTTALTTGIASVKPKYFACAGVLGCAALASLD